nr:hypothetical protein [Akkermansiaceae bacterium]
GAAVAQFAAHADYETLAAAQSAGRILIDQLLQERTRILTEGRTARSLQETLLQNVSDEDRPRSLLGASLLG